MADSNTNLVLVLADSDGMEIARRLLRLASTTKLHGLELSEQVDEVVESVLTATVAQQVDVLSTQELLSVYKDRAAKVAREALSLAVGSVEQVEVPARSR